MSLKRLGFLNETGQKVEPDHITLINYGFKKGAIVIEITGMRYSFFLIRFQILRALFLVKKPC